MDCKQCIFAQYGQELNVLTGMPANPSSADMQIGCGCDRLYTFEDRNEAYRTVGKPYYQLTKFCNMYRTDDWRTEVQKKYAEEFDTPNHSFLEDLVDIARYEVKPLFGVAVWDVNEGSFEDLENTTLNLMNIDYPRNKIKVMISTFTTRGVNKVSDLVNRLQVDIKNSAATFHMVEDRKIRDTDIFKKLVEASFFVLIKSGATLPSGLFNRIDESVNDDLEKVCMWEGDGYTVINKRVATSLYLQFNDYEKMVDHIRELSNKQGVYQKI